MKNICLYLVFIICMFIAFQGVCVASNTCGDSITYTLHDGVLTISGSGDMTDWGRMQAPWYSQRAEIKSVVIENGVTSIGNYAFYSCGHLMSVSLSDSVTCIGNYAFGGCSNLDNIEFGAGVRDIDYGAFNGCYSLKNIVLPDSITNVGEKVFYGCKALIRVSFGSGLKELDISSFENCGNLKEIKISSDNQNYYSDEYGVLYNKSKTKVLLCPPKAEIYYYSIPSSVTEISEKAFYNVVNLMYITLGAKVNSIGNYAFSGCDNIVSVTNKSDLQISIGLSEHGMIGKNAYKITDSKGNVVYKSGYTDNGEGFLFNSSDILCVYVGGRDTVTLPLTYKRNEYDIYCLKGVKNLIIPVGMKKIDNYAFAGNHCLTSITIPDTVEFIGEYSFEACVSLKNVNIPDSVTNIGEAAFNSCVSLEYAKISNNVACLNFGVFGYCTSLSTIILPKNLVEIKDEVFVECSKLKSIVIPDGVESIDYLCFVECNALTQILIPESVTHMGEDIFERSDNVVIYGKSGSCAHIYADTYELDFVDVANVKKGDTNGDGVIDLKDVTAARRYLAGGYGSFCIESALKVNDDSVADLKDVTVIRRYLAGGYNVELK